MRTKFNFKRFMAIMKREFLQISVDKISLRMPIFMTVGMIPPKIVFSSIVGSIFMFILKRNMDSLYANVEQDDNIDKDIDILIDIMFNGIGAKF